MCFGVCSLFKYSTAQFAECNARLWDRIDAAFSITQMLHDLVLIGPAVWCIWRSWIVIVASWRNGKPSKAAPKSTSCWGVAVRLCDEEKKRQSEKPKLSSAQVTSTVWSSPTHYTTYTAGSGWKNNKLKRRKYKQKSRGSQRGERMNEQQKETVSGD